MALFQAIGIARKVFKGVRGTIRAKRRARKARAKLKKAERLERGSQRTLAAAGFGAMQAKLMGGALEGAPSIAPVITEVQEQVFGGTPNTNSTDSDPTTTFTSTGGGGVEKLKWYERLPMWAWFLIAPVGLVLLVILFRAIFKRR